MDIKQITVKLRVMLQVSPGDTNAKTHVPV